MFALDFFKGVDQLSVTVKFFVLSGRARTEVWYDKIIRRQKHVTLLTSRKGH